MTIKQFIEKAIEGGWKPKQQAQFIIKWGREEHELRAQIGDSAFLDPLAWEAVGRAQGNKEEMRCDKPKCDSRLCEYAGYWDWKRKMIGMVEALVYSEMTVEEYLQSL
jgi:hypothetical protein